MTADAVRALRVGDVVWNGTVKGYVARNDPERQIVHIEWEKPDPVPWDEAVRLTR